MWSNILDLLDLKLDLHFDAACQLWKVTYCQSIVKLVVGIFEI